MSRKTARQIRHFRIRKRVFGTAERPRLAVFSSNRHFYAQIINDDLHHTLVSYSTLNLPNQPLANLKTAELIGAKIAELAKTQKIQEIVFDRAGFLFHGLVKSFADAARKGGLKF